MSTLDIDSMRALAVIAETGGITRAAKKLNLSQSAVSHKMKRLEKRLNRKLLARGDGRLVLTADGEKLLDYARRLVRLLSEGFVFDEDQPLAYVAYHRDCFYKAWAERALAEAGRSLRVVFECPSIDGMVNAVRSGLGAGLVNLDVFEQLQSGRRGDSRGLRIDRSVLPQPPPIQHVARFAAGVPTRQMDKLLELIKKELSPVA